MGKSILLFNRFVLVLLLLISVSGMAAEVSCRHIFHDHTVDGMRSRFLKMIPKEKMDTIRSILQVSGDKSTMISSYFENTYNLKSIEYSAFEKKLILEPLVEDLNKKVGFFYDRDLRYSIVKDVNGDIWAIMVSRQVSHTRIEELAIYSLEYNSYGKKVPRLIAAKQDSSIL